MPQVKIHVSDMIKDSIKGKLAVEVSETMSRHADIDDDILQVMVYESQYRISDYHMSSNFVLIEVLTSKEKSFKDKQLLANLLIDKVEQLTNIDSKEITVVYNYKEEVKYFGIAKNINQSNEAEEKSSNSIVNSIEKDLNDSKKDTINLSKENKRTIFNEQKDINQNNNQYERSNLQGEPNFKDSDKKIENNSFNNIGIEKKNNSFEIREKGYEETNFITLKRVDSETNEKRLFNGLREKNMSKMNIEEDKNDLITREIILEKEKSNEIENSKINFNQNREINNVTNNSSNRGNGTFELLYYSDEGMVNVTENKILNL